MLTFLIRTWSGTTKKADRRKYGREGFHGRGHNRDEGREELEGNREGREWPE
jgi:hypothetical protein